MRNPHLSEEQLQQSALGNNMVDPQILDHLAHCPSCHLQYKIYRQLFQGIRETESPSFSFKVEDIVLAQFPKVETRPLLPSNWLYGLGAVLLALTILTGMVFRSKLLFLLVVGSNPILLAMGGIFILGMMLLQLTSLYRSYREKIDALNYH